MGGNATVRLLSDGAIVDFCSALLVWEMNVSVAGRPLSLNV